MKKEFGSMSFDPYDTLGLPSPLKVVKGTEFKCPTVREISKAYKKQALLWHPDKHRGEKNKKNAQDKFEKIVQAYEILKDDDLRKNFEDYAWTRREQMERLNLSNTERKSFIDDL
jgi:DnaJ-class molecular chaperone